MATQESIETINAKLRDKYVRITDIFFFIQANIFKEEVNGYHLVISPKSEGTNETTIKAWAIFNTEEQGLQFLVDLQMIADKHGFKEKRR